MSIKTVTTDYSIHRLEIDVIPFVEDKIPMIKFTAKNLSDETISIIFKDIDKYFEEKSECN